MVLTLQKYSDYEDSIAIKLASDSMEFGFIKKDFIIVVEKSCYSASDVVYFKPNGTIARFKDINTNDKSVVGKIVAMYRQM